MDEDSYESFSVLVDHARSGDERALAELAGQYEAEVRIAARVLLGPLLRPHVDSMDLVQSIHRNLLIGLRNNKFEFTRPEQLLGTGADDGQTQGRPVRASPVTPAPVDCRSSDLGHLAVGQGERGRSRGCCPARRRTPLLYGPTQQHRSSRGRASPRGLQHSRGPRGTRISTPTSFEFA